MESEKRIQDTDADINALMSLLLEMGGLVEQQLEHATTALHKDDQDLAKQVLKRDRGINDLEAELNECALAILQDSQAEAEDLRVIVMSLKIARHLERVGDYAKNMARRIRTISKAEAFTGSIETLVRMSELVQNMVHMALDAYSKHDDGLAFAVRNSDILVDQMHNTLFLDLLTFMTEDSQNISGAIHLLLIARNLERMGDHIADIGNETIYMVRGEWPKSRRSKGDKTSRMIVDFSARQTRSTQKGAE